MPNNQKRGLGRGLDGLIPTTIDPLFDPTASKDELLSRTHNLLITDIYPNPEQPRRNFSSKELSELAQSIKEHGILQPIVVIQDNDKYTLVAGERRWRAASSLGHTHIPAIIRTLDAQSQLEVALIENIQREDLAPLEMATALVKLNQQFNQNLETIAARLGKAHTTLINVTRLLNLPDPAKRALSNKKITEGHARQILALDDAKIQQELLDYIVRHGWSVRKAEQFVTAIKEGAKDKKSALRSTMSQTIETKLVSKAIGADVHIQKMAKGGRIVIRYKDDKHYNELVKKLSKTKD